MRTYFKISFKKKVEDINKEEFIKLFLINSKGKLYYKEKNANNDIYIIKGNFFSFNNINTFMDLWAWFSHKVVIEFDNDNTVTYTVDFTYGIIYYVLIMSFLFLFSIKAVPIIFIILGIIFIFIVGDIIVKIMLHRKVFLETLNHKNRLLGDYDWSEIMKNKTDKELTSIIKSGILPDEVKKLAKLELEKRKHDYTKTTN